MVIRELTENERQAWNDFVGANPYGDVLQSWEWGEVKGAGEWRPLRLAAFDEGGKITGGIAILVRSLPVVGTLYYAPRGPVMADWSNTKLLQDLLGAVREYAGKDRAAFLKIDPAVPSEQQATLKSLSCEGFGPPADSDPQGFGGTQPRCVMVLDIAGKSEEDLLAAMKPQCRRNIRIAEKKGIEVISDTTREYIAPFYEILKVTAERDGFTVRGQAYYETLWDKLAERGLAKLFLTRYEAQYLSGALCFLIGDKCWYVYGASSNEHRNLMPNYAMQWAMIRWAKEQGCSVYDFRGVSPRQKAEGENAEELEKEDHLQGLNRFKAGFGARYVEYIG
ncbi:MAG TPA: peptidoglycan bridge formation glycyltransferase FemA/FemB family protein, partial [Capsulimonadaceae bacterium]|nr:peptidoglycan bridge formation glycyltransferase FemA/FemB family protein [Capsulimonadaceae bacterium]